MHHSIRILSVAASSVLFCAAAGAADFTAAFPCQAKLTTQTVAAGKTSIPVANQSCEKDSALYYVVASTFPKGFIAKKTAKAAFADAIGGAAANVKGTIRADKPITLAGVAGHDALIDLKDKKAAVHLRVFFVGDKQYQVMVVGPAGQENGKAAMGFLESFKLGK
jgi:hypothetical protein